MSSLTEEQKQRIEQEERSRLAEEAYRQEVRRKLASPVPTPVPPPMQPAHAGPRPATTNWAGFILKAAIVVLIVGAILWFNSRPTSTGPGSPSPTSSPLFSSWVPVSEQLVTGQFQVPARSFRSWTITVPTGTRNYRVTGHYSAIGGGGNDIAAVIATEDEFQNWINGHQARIFYASPGKVTNGDIDVKGLPPGRYILAFSNTFSLLANKAVFAEISATHLK